MNAVDWFLEQAGRYPLLTAEQEITLGRKVQDWMAIRDLERHTPAQKRTAAAGIRAYRRFYHCNLRLVVSISKKYINRAQSMAFEDLIQEGCLGLGRAIELFDPSKGYKFSTYATWWIRQGCTRGIANFDRTIRIPSHSLDALNKMRWWVPTFQHEHGRLPTIAECAEICKVSEFTIQNSLRLKHDATSLNKVSNDGDGSEIIDLIRSHHHSPTEHAEKEFDLQQFETAFGQLKEQEQDILVRHFGLNGGDPESLSTIGKTYGVTRERIRQIESKALLRMRNYMGRELVEVA